MMAPSPPRKAYITFKEHLPFIRLQLRLTSAVNASYLEWDEEMGRVVSVDGRRPKYLFPLITIGLYIFFLAYKMGVVLSRTKEAYINNIVSILVFVGALFGYLMGAYAFTKAGDVADFYNALLKKDERQDGGIITLVAVQLKRKLKKEKEELLKISFHKQWIKEDIRCKNISRLTLTIATTSFATVPFFLLFFLLISPCNLKLMLRSSIQGCPSPVLLPKILAPLAILWDFFFVFYTYGQGVTGIAYFFYLGVKCIGEQLQRTKCVLKWKKGGRRGLMKSFQSYHQVQLLERHFNNVNRGALMPMVMADVVLLGVIALYSAIALHAKLSLPMLVVVVVLAFDAVILTQIGVYRAAAAVNSLSLEMQRSWRSSKIVQTDAYLRRVVRSCNSLKVQMGNSGLFLERTTPLFITQLTVEQTTSLLLISARE